MIRRSLTESPEWKYHRYFSTRGQAYGLFQNS